MGRYIFDLETTSLEPSVNGRIVCIAVYNIEKNEEKAFFNLDESILIREFFDYIGMGSELVGFNISQFDVPYLIHRSLVRRQKIPKFKTIDLRQIANGFFHSYNKFAKGDLAYWASVLGIEQDTSSGSMVPALFVAGKYDEIIKHCQEDVSITRKLYDLIDYCGIMPDFEDKSMWKKRHFTSK